MTELQDELVALILKVAEKTMPASGIAASEALFGPHARLGLDSMDALQISMAIQKRYGVRMVDSKETRRALANLTTLSAHITQHRKK